MLYYWLALLFVLFYFLGGYKKKMSKELTDAWKAGKLKALRLYYVLYKNGHIGKANLIQTPDYYGFWNNCDLNDLIKEVLALVPEYTEFVHLETIVARQAERIKELEKEIEFKQRYINARTSPVYREKTYRLQKASIDELTSLLKDCKLSIIKIYDRLRFSDENEITPADLINGIDDIKPMLYNIVTRISAALSESEEK